MRISDWSSDVCSSDLIERKIKPVLIQMVLKCFQDYTSLNDSRAVGGTDTLDRIHALQRQNNLAGPGLRRTHPDTTAALHEDRQSFVWGKGGPERECIGVSRIL